MCTVCVLPASRPEFVGHFMFHWISMSTTILCVHVCMCVCVWVCVGVFFLLPRTVRPEVLSLAGQESRLEEDVTLTCTTRATLPLNVSSASSCLLKPFITHIGTINPMSKDLASRIQKKLANNETNFSLPEYSVRPTRSFPPIPEYFEHTRQNNRDQKAFSLLRVSWSKHSSAEARSNEKAFWSLLFCLVRRNSAS